MRYLKVFIVAALLSASAAVAPAFADEVVDVYSYNELDALIRVEVRCESDGHGGWHYIYWVTVYVSQSPRLLSVFDAPAGPLRVRGQQQDDIANHLDPNGNGVGSWNDPTDVVPVGTGVDNRIE